VGRAPGPVLLGQRRAETLLAGDRVDVHLARHAVAVDLGDRARDHVEPFVGHDEGALEVDQLSRQARTSR
jgi:hypothetical protein